VDTAVVRLLVERGARLDIRDHHLARHAARLGNSWRGTAHRRWPMSAVARCDGLASPSPRRLSQPLVRASSVVSLAAVAANFLSALAAGDRDRLAAGDLVTGIIGICQKK